jgi:exopolyphosphatase / guanosine-5'-triphosphate,3'-diphosphate pyrophosphatase
MSKKVAVIDLGTNTFNLLIADLNENNGFQKIHSHRIPVLLGKETINEGYLSQDAIERGLKALWEFSLLLKKFEVKEIKALATSAVRTARNAMDFTSRAKSEIGIEIQIISGEKEAELIFHGNAAAASLTENNSLIIDIGGGSTEFIIGNRDGIVWKESFPLGAARLIHRFYPEDPLTANTRNKIESYLLNELQPLFEAINTYPVYELIGSSGAFDSFVEMMNATLENSNENATNICFEYSLSEFDNLASIIIQSNRSAREKMNGLIPMRVEMIVVATVLVQLILNKLQLKKMRSTTWSLKEGAILTLFD